MGLTFQTHPLGDDGLLARFADRLDLDANDAAVVLAGQLEAAGLEGVVEVALALVSVYLRFDPDLVSYEALERQVQALTDTDNAAFDPQASKLVRVPVCFEGPFAPQMDEVAEEVGLSPDAAVDDICAQALRVLTLGFAPGQPYLGLLPERWDIPRQAGLTPRVETGAVVVAARQFVIFSTPAATGWRQIGQTPLRLFDPANPRPAVLSAGIRVQLEPVSRAEYNKIDPFVLWSELGT